MKILLGRIGGWFEKRLDLKETVWPMLRHPVPSGARWWYVFGSATLTLFVLQLLTGVCLALVYVPSPNQAFESLEYMNYHEFLGWYIRALHYWAATGMVCMLFVHLTQVFLFGAFKYPRELTWLVGVVLLILTLGMAFTGQVLRWDQDAYWGVGVGASMAGRVPLIGPQVVQLLLGGPEIGSATLSRFFTLHVFVVPGLLIFFLAIHLYLVLKKGISEPPVPGKPVVPEKYQEEYEKMLAERRRAVLSGCHVARCDFFVHHGPGGPGRGVLRRALRAEQHPGPNADRQQSATGLVFPLAVRAAGAVAAAVRNFHHAGAAALAVRHPGGDSVRRRPGGTELAAAGRSRC